MKELITVSQTKIGTKEVPAVSARELYLGLGLDKSNWSRWSKENLEENEFFSQGVDFIQLVIMTSAENPNPPKEFAVSLEFAKHISMMAKTSKGHEYRNYFIELEREVTSSVKEKIEIDLMFADFAFKTLNLPDSGKLAILGKIEKAHGITSFLPSYAIDAPTTSGSSLVTFSASALLENFGKPMSAQKFNIISIERGFIQELTRPSTTKGTKTFKSLTEKGLKFGKNLTSPQNPRETTPHYYHETFSELLELLK